MTPTITLDDADNFIVKFPGGRAEAFAPTPAGITAMRNALRVWTKANEPKPAPAAKQRWYRPPEYQYDERGFRKRPEPKPTPLPKEIADLNIQIKL